jgi:hypothetical protein
MTLFSCWEHSEIKNSFMSLREIGLPHPALEEVAEKVVSGQEPRPQRLKPYSNKCSYRSAEALRHLKSRATSSFSAACEGASSVPRLRYV